MQCTAQVIELGLSFALEKSVDGKQGLYNEIKNEYHPAPCYDHIDTGYIVHYKGIALPKHTYVFADEGQDMNKLDCMTVEGLVKPNGGILVADDDSQTLFSFAGANKVCAHMHGGKGVEVEGGSVLTVTAHFLRTHACGCCATSGCTKTWTTTARVVLS